MMNYRNNGCTICPRECGVDRSSSLGVCTAGEIMEISSWNLHLGEEPPLSGTGGSGTIFFAHCSLKCIFCQNYPISHMGHSRVFSEDEFIKIILELQEKGAHNINLVTPTHYSVSIKKALKKIKGDQLRIPVVYNTSGYEKVETLKTLEGLVDIYMPDAKYSESSLALKLSGAADYSEINRNAILEMQRQTGDLIIDINGIATRGLLIRHLVLPGNLSNTIGVLDFIAEKLGISTHLSLMSQYHPAYKTVGMDIFGRRLNEEEYAEAVEYAVSLGLENCFCQDI
ncbi:MAG: radical SAM protein [Elusimicrobiota bacterium]